MTNAGGGLASLARRVLDRCIDDATLTGALGRRAFARRMEAKVHYTEKVRARRLVAEGLAEQPARLAAARLKAKDVRVVADQGRIAEEADAQQRADLAQSSVEVTQRAGEIAKMVSLERELRDTVSAAVDDLHDDGHEALALFLGRISYARFRIRDLKPDGDAAAGEAEVVKKLERVPREDQVARLDGLAGFIGAVLAPGREAIAAELAERGFSADALGAARTQAMALAEAGRNRQAASTWTEREEAAVAAQSKKWSAIRRLVRRAVQGDDALVKLFAEA
jgi:hypothetical protein